MHFEILIEDHSDKKLLESILPYLISTPHTYKLYSYKGIGHIPKNLSHVSDPAKRILLERLPQILKGYGETYKNIQNFEYAIIIICDLDKRCRKDFRLELLNILNSCNPKPKANFCIAVEEIESWLLGDLQAVQKAYPNAKMALLNAYKNDAICGTWELLANAVYKGGAKALAKYGYQKIGLEKYKWVEKISPFMNLTINKSPSFQYFKKKIEDLTGNH